MRKLRLIHNDEYTDVIEFPITNELTAILRTKCEKIETPIVIRIKYNNNIYFFTVDSSPALLELLNDIPQEKINLITNWIKLNRTQILNYYYNGLTWTEEELEKNLHLASI